MTPDFASYRNDVVSQLRVRTHGIANLTSKLPSHSALNTRDWGQRMILWTANSRSSQTSLKSLYCPDARIEDRSTPRPFPVGSMSTAVRLCVALNEIKKFFGLPWSYLSYMRLMSLPCVSCLSPISSYCRRPAIRQISFHLCNQQNLRHFGASLFFKFFVMHVRLQDILFLCLSSDA